jgi:hypothetical protein
MLAPAIIEYTAGDDPALDFCLWPYQPPAPAADKLRSLTLLMQTFELCGVAAPGREVVEALRRGIGPFMTVWGVKWVDGRLKWEFYFYDYARLERERSMTRVFEVLRPLIPSRVRPNEGHPYFMFSIDFTEDTLRGRAGFNEAHMYIGNPGSSVSSGIAYTVGANPDENILENFYFFFDAARQMEEVRGKVACSAFLAPAAVDLDAILWPELRECQVLVVANKRFNDAVYFSRIDVRQLGIFLERLGYPEPLAALVRDEGARLDHMLYDVGIDYRVDGGAVRILKSGFYGVF